MTARVNPHEDWEVEKINYIRRNKRTKKLEASVNWKPVALPGRDVDEKLVRDFLNAPSIPAEKRQYKIDLSRIIDEHMGALNLLANDLEGVLGATARGVTGVHTMVVNSEVHVTWIGGTISAGHMRSRLWSWLHHRIPSGSYHIAVINRTFKVLKKLPKGSLNTIPEKKIVFNAPYDDKHTYHMKIVNSTTRRIGWAIKTTNMKPIGVEPACGVLDPKEDIRIVVFCYTFAYSQEDTNNDRITIEWTNVLDGVFSPQLLERGSFNRKTLSIEYNT